MYPQTQLTWNKKLNDRWTRLSAKVTRIITKIINQIERKLRQRLPQRELEQIVHRALSARYPDAYYRLRNDTQPAKLGSLGSSLLYNLSVMDIGPARNSLWRCTYDMFVDKIGSSRTVTLAVVTKPGRSYCDDPRGEWRVSVDESVLRVMNPDLPSGTDSSSDSDRVFESSGSQSASVLGLSNLELLTNSSSESGGSEWSTINSETNDEVSREHPIIRITSPVSLTQKWSDEDFEYSESNSSSDIGKAGVSALCVSAGSQSSTECNGSEYSDESSTTKVNWVSCPCSDDVVPQVPDLYFIDRPDPPLCCLITSDLRNSNSSILKDDDLCSCSSTIPTDPMAELVVSRETIAKDQVITEETIIAKGKHPQSGDGIIELTYGKRNALLYRKAAGTEHLAPLPLTIRKKNNAILGTRQDAPLPLTEAFGEPAKPYNLRNKLLYGELPPIPLSSLLGLWENQVTHQPMTVHVSASVSALSRTNAPQTQQKILCSSCRDIRERRKALNSHPTQDRHQPGEQGPVPTEKSFNPNDLPSPLRAGPRCTHCRNTWSGMVSTPALLSLQISTRDEGESLEYISGASRANSSLDDFKLADIAFHDGENSFSRVSPELRLCLYTGKVARNCRR
jgi:hypothetical protein